METGTFLPCGCSVKWFIDKSTEGPYPVVHICSDHLNTIIKNTFGTEDLSFISHIDNARLTWAIHDDYGSHRCQVGDGPVHIRQPSAMAGEQWTIGQDGIWRR